MSSIVIVLFFLLACTGQNGRDLTGSALVQDEGQSSLIQADMVFDTLGHNFGTILEGEMVVCYFDYENRGGSDLVISSVEATCGCTSPDWSKEPLKPGEKGRLKIVFDASGRSGSQLKTVSVNSNSSSEQMRLTIRANVTNNK